MSREELARFLRGLLLGAAAATVAWAIFIEWLFS